MEKRIVEEGAWILIEWKSVVSWVIGSRLSKACGMLKKERKEEHRALLYTPLEEAVL